MGALDSLFAFQIVASLVAAWPEALNANTAKETLLLHEYETLLDYAPVGDLAMSVPAILPKLVACIESDNWRLVEKVLSLWKNDTFAFLCTCRGTPPERARLGALERKKGGGASGGASGGGVDLAAVVYPPMMAALLRGGKPHWNPTVSSVRDGDDESSRR